jgi:hypothetical protein
MISIRAIVLLMVRVLASFLVACIAAYIVFFSHGRISAAMAGVPLHELSEDYGGAFQAVLFSIVAFLIAFALCIWVMGRLLGKLKGR